MTRQLNEITKEELEEAVKNSESIADVLRYLDIPVNNGKYRSIKSIAYNSGVELPIWDNRLATKKAIKRNTISQEDFFQFGVARSGSGLRNRMIKLGIPYTCSNEQCFLHGKTDWNENVLVFQVDHTNGNNLDNRLENLRFLCPNCHSQTETYGNRNKINYTTCICGRKALLNGMDDTICIHTNSQKDIPFLKKSFSNKICLDCSSKILGESKRCSNCEKQNRKIEYTPMRIFPEIEEIILNIKEKGYLAYGKELNISDNGIRKHLLRKGVNPLPKKLTKKEKKALNLL